MWGLHLIFGTLTPNNKKFKEYKEVARLVSGSKRQFPF